MPAPKLTNEIITAAILGFEEQKNRIDTRIAELRATLSPGTAESTEASESSGRKRRKMSAATRKAMAEGQRKRWATAKAQSAPEAAAALKPKRKMSAAGRAAIVAALKKRWAAKKAEAKK
jgi:hypothetical protein